MGENYVYVSTQSMLEIGTKRLQDIGVKPELEIFDTGQLWFAKHMIQQGLIDEVVDVDTFYNTERLRPKYKAFQDLPLFIMTSDA